MYLAALRRQHVAVSTYFADVLGVVGGGGTPKKQTPPKQKCYGQKMTGQKMTT